MTPPIKINLISPQENYKKLKKKFQYVFDEYFYSQEHNPAFTVTVTGNLDEKPVTPQGASCVSPYRRNKMKRTAIVILMILTAFSLYGQESETLISGHIESSGFGGPVVKFTRIDGDFAVLVGGRGGWIINHSFSIGIGGYGLVNDIHPGGDIPLSQRIQMGYGGLILEGIIASNKLVHLTVGTLIGAGGVAHGYQWFDDWDCWYDDDWGYSYHRNPDVFFVLEPEINLMLNVARFFRIGIGASYRYATETDREWISDDDLSGFSASLTFKFGVF